MRFDILSFVIGFISASVIAFILYRLRARITTIQEAAESQVGSTRKFITNSSEGRYYNDLVKQLNAYHIAGDVIRLAEIYVEPRFLRLPDPIDPSGEDQSTNVFSVVPQIHDFPASYAPYNLDTLSINDLRNGETHLALLGLPGSGKSTALAIIGLFAIGEIDIATIDIMTDEVFEDEIKNLPPDERDKQIQKRKDLQSRALEQLKQVQPTEDADKPARIIANFEKLIPLLVHLRDVDLRPEAYGAQAKSKDKAAVTKTLDPAEPLVKALQLRLGGVTASTLPRMIYNRLTAGTCLVLIDGYDDIPADLRPAKLLWLRQFMETYHNNFIIVAGPENGYDPLINLGLTPVFLRAWSDSDYDRLVQRWTLSWPKIGKSGRRAAAIPEDKIVRRVATNNRGRLPLDVTLKAWAAFSGDEKEAGRRGWYDFYVRHRLETLEGHAAIEKIAATILDQDGKPLSREQMKTVATAALTGPDGRATTNVDELLNKLTVASKLMVDWPGNTFSFSHLLLTGFLAAESLEKATADTLNVIAARPAWEIALPFAAAHIPADMMVNRRLSSTPDLLYTGLFSLVTWLPEAPPNATWRAEVFKRLTAALLATSQYPVIRERAMAALVTSRDKSVFHIFKQAFRSTTPTVRRLGCIGIGALGESDAIKDLENMLVDPDNGVQLAAGLALGAIGTPLALETMVKSMVNGEQNLRRAVAETLAAVPGEGHGVLRDAITSEDMYLRYAAVYGLARVRAAWSLALLYRALIEDAQWYVRNAAEQAFRDAERPEVSSISRHPEADNLTWLAQWAAKKGEGIPAGVNARQVLVRALQEGDPSARAAAALTLANLGHVPALKPLYSALRDRDDSVRSAVYEALSQLQVRLGEELPAVV